MVDEAGSGASLADFIRKNAEDLWGDLKLAEIDANLKQVETEIEVTQ